MHITFLAPARHLGTVPPDPATAGLLTPIRHQWQRSASRSRGPEPGIAAPRPARRPGAACNPPLPPGPARSHPQAALTSSVCRPQAPPSAARPNVGIGGRNRRTPGHLALLLVSSREDYQIDLLGPTRQDYRWQAREGQGFAASNFIAQWAEQTGTCPEGKQSAK
jgi:hypothetical protein